jgi:hypothetical protein
MIFVLPVLPSGILMKGRGTFFLKKIRCAPTNVLICNFNYRTDQAGVPVPDLKSIPDEVKWRLAAQLAALLPALYDRAYRGVVGEKYDEIEQEIWMDLSRMVFDIVRDLSLPTSNAGELADSLRTVMGILFGPDYKSETLEISKGGAVVLVKRCPLPDSSLDRGAGDPSTFHKCMVLTLTTVPLLNKGYSARFVRTMCTGDRQCEIKIEEAIQPENSEHKKKK